MKHFVKSLHHVKSQHDVCLYAVILLFVYCMLSLLIIFGDYVERNGI